MKKRASLLISGNVQMAGFRTFIKNVADSLNVTGFAENEMVALMRSFEYILCQGKCEFKMLACQWDHLLVSASESGRFERL